MKIAIVVIVTAAMTVAGLTLTSWGLGAVLAPLRGQSDSTVAAVRLEHPQRGSLTERVSAPGEVEPRKRVSISARVSGRIEALPYKEGDRVTRGDDDGEPSVLVRLDASDLEASLRSAEAGRRAQAKQIEVSQARIQSQQASIEGMRASLAEAERDLARQAQLYESRDVSQAAVDQAQRQVDELRAQLEAAEHSLDADRLNIDALRLNLEAADAEISRARENLKHTTITSPIDGVVTRLHTEEGETVTGAQSYAGTVILDVADLARMLFVAQVDEADVGEMEVGQRANVRLQAYPDREFAGEVEAIALRHDVAGDGSKYFKTEIALETDGRRIYSGLSGDAEILTRHHEQVLTLPTAAVLGRRVDELPAEVRDGNPHVDDEKTFAAVAYRFVDGRAVATPVTIGASDATRTIITAGLDEDDRVIVGPYSALETLEHNQAVIDERARTAAASAAAQQNDEADR